MFSLTEFKESFSDGFAKSSKFRLELTAPSKLNLLGNIARNLTFLCEVAELPGRSVATGERRVYGPTQKVPYNTIYNDLNVTFMCDGKLNIRKTFDDWLDLIVNKNTHDINYLDDYACTIDIIQLDRFGKNVRRYSMRDAFPINIEGQAVSWSDTDSILKLNVVFTYKTWQAFEF